MARRSMIKGKTRHLSGWIPDRGDHRDQTYSTILKAPLPSLVDLRALCPRVENQGDEGSCTANSSTSAIEFLYKKMGIEQPELSRQFLYYATRVWIAKGSPSEDSGAMLRDVLKALAKYGTCLESVWPYKLEYLFTEPSNEAKENAKAHQIQRFFKLPNLATIRTCLAHGYPAVGGFSVPTSFMDEEATSTGLTAYPKKDEELVGGHAVLFVGYDDARRLLIFQNSWGEEWGDKGFGYLPYEYVIKGLADDFWTVQGAEL